MALRWITIGSALFLIAVPIVGTEPGEGGLAPAASPAAVRPAWPDTAHAGREAPVRVRIEPVAISAKPTGETLEASIEVENTSAINLSYSASLRITTDRGQVIVPTTSLVANSPVGAQLAKSTPLSIGHGYSDGYYVVSSDVTWAGSQSDGTTGAQLFVQVANSRVYVISADEYYLYSAANEGVLQP